MLARSFALAAFAFLISAGVDGDGQRATSAFDLLQACIALDPGDIRRLDAGKTIARVLAEDDGHIAVFGARRIAADGDRLVAWMRQIEQLRQGKFVESLARFSNPPSVTDVSQLVLDEDDLDGLRECVPGQCRVKLTAAEIALMRRDIDAAGLAWSGEADRLFRRFLVERVTAYRTRGLGAIDRYADGRTPASLQTIFRSLLDHTPCLSARLVGVRGYLEKYPDVSEPELETVFYWSKERLRGKPIISATQMIFAAAAGPGWSVTAAVTKQLFATHYINGSLNVTAIVASDRGNYLVILNRTNVDFVRGFFGGVARFAVERGVKAELPGILDHLARTLESGPPSGAPTSQRKDPRLITRHGHSEPLAIWFSPLVTPSRPF